MRMHSWGRWRTCLLWRRPLCGTRYVSFCLPSVIHRFCILSALRTFYSRTIACRYSELTPTTGGRVGYENIRGSQPSTDRAILHSPRTETVARRVVHFPHIVVCAVPSRVRQGRTTHPGRSSPSIRRARGGRAPRDVGYLRRLGRDAVDDLLPRRDGRGVGELHRNRNGHASACAQIPVSEGLVCRPMKRYPPRPL